MPDPAAAVPAVPRGSTGEISAARLTALERAAADPHGHAERIRRMLGIRPACPDEDDRYESPFRRVAGYHPVHLCQLRQIAAEQAAESRMQKTLQGAEQ